MSAFVVDTNVAVVANATDTHADADCVLACINALAEIVKNGIVVIDNANLILLEYHKNLNLSGQPGPGDGFMKWLWSVQAVAARCERVAVTPGGPDGNDFVEFPRDPALVNFDREDRKFVAVAVKSRLAPHILNAVDSDWKIHHGALVRNKVTIRFLCPQHVCPS
jgi:hypothetical protein